MKTPVTRRGRLFWLLRLFKAQRRKGAELIRYNAVNDAIHCIAENLHDELRLRCDWQSFSPAWYSVFHDGEMYTRLDDTIAAFELLLEKERTCPS